MKKVRCILADDEVLSVELLQSYVLKLDNYEVVAMWSLVSIIFCTWISFTKWFPPSLVFQKRGLT